jgi:hypothetical protein
LIALLKSLNALKFRDWSCRVRLAVVTPRGDIVRPGAASRRALAL